MLVCYYHSISSGTGIDGELAVQFGGVTGSSISLHNLSIATLQADYDPFIAPDRDLSYPEEETWEVGEGDSEPWMLSSCNQDNSTTDFLGDRAYDWLEADDPALYSDEFSEPEEWGINR